MQSEKFRIKSLNIINEYRKSSYLALSAATCLVTDVLQPLAPFSRELFVGSIFVSVVLLFLSFNSNIKSKLKNTLSFFVLLSVFSGGIWAIQESGYDKYGILASFSPQVQNFQESIGIIEKLEDIEGKIVVVGEDVKDIKSEVTKNLSFNFLIAELEQCTTSEEKEKIIIQIKKYDFERLISGNQLLSILDHFSGRKRADLSHDLAKFTRPDLSSSQFFSIITPDMDIQEFGHVYPYFSVKLGEPLSFTDYMKHINKIPIATNKLFQASALARHLESLSEGQKADLAPILGAPVDMVDMYL